MAAKNVLSRRKAKEQNQRSKEILERCQRGMELIKSACEGKLFADVDVAYAFSSLQIPEEEEIEEEDDAGTSRRRREERGMNRHQNL